MAPETAAWLQMTAELACAPLLFLGLMSRLAALPLLLFSAQLYVAYPAVGDSLYWMLLLGALIVRGSGSISFDAKFAPSLFSSALPFTRLSLRLSGFLTSFGSPPVSSVLARVGGPNVLQSWLGNRPELECHDSALCERASAHRTPFGSRGRIAYGRRDRGGRDVSGLASQAASRH